MIKIGTGDFLKTPFVLGSRHYAVMFINKKSDKMIIEHGSYGVRTTPLKDFIEKNPQVNIVHNNLNDTEIQKMNYRIKRALKSYSKYNLIFDNCEHFARHMVGQEKNSEQIRMSFLLTLVGSLLWQPIVSHSSTALIRAVFLLFYTSII